MTPHGNHEELPLYILWSDFLKWMLDHTEKFPRKARFTFITRIDNMMLDTLEDIIEARYTKNRLPILKRINLRIEKLRQLLRICYDRRFLAANSFEYAIKTLNEAGRMTGGWMKQAVEIK